MYRLKEAKLQLHESNFYLERMDLGKYFICQLNKNQIKKVDKFLKENEVLSALDFAVIKDNSFIFFERWFYRVRLKGNKTSIGVDFQMQDFNKLYSFIKYGI